MGLGLTISKMIVQQMGGAIDVESVAGEGSNFFFTVPLLELPENNPALNQVSPVLPRNENQNQQ